MENNVVLEKSFAFALRIAKLYRYLIDQQGAAGGRDKYRQTRKRGGICRVA